MMGHKATTRDEIELEQVMGEIRTNARKLLAEQKDGKLNWYSDVAARGDALRIVRAAIELLPPTKP